MIEDKPDLIAALRKSTGDHKYSHGHALVLSGGVGRGGAARLAARAALRVGAGLVTVGCPPAALQENAARLDAVMLRSLRDGADLRDMLGDPRITALCLGPGLGEGARALDMVETAVQFRRAGTAPLRVILDADALTLLARSPQLLTYLHGHCFVTPHQGEFARLCPELAQEAGAQTDDPTQQKSAVVQAARRLGCGVLLKGAVTIVASPDGAVMTHDATGARAAPWLATAGSGDVLAGLITGLAARGVPMLQAALWGAYLHVECALAFGPGLIAEDLPDVLPGVLGRLRV